MTALVDELLSACWPDGLPPRLDELVDRRRADELIADFKLEPVFPFEGETRPVRLCWSAEGGPEQWRQAVAAAWPSPAIGPFLAQAPAGTRWMVDSDGSAAAQLYLDDLQQGGEPAKAPSEHELMCLTLDLPSGRLGRLCRHADPPLAQLGGVMKSGLERLLAAGAVGLYALRWQEAELARAGWISETRWRRNPATARRAVRALGGHPRYDQALAALARQGRIGYPDVVEIYADGRIDVTLGVL